MILRTRQPVYMHTYITQRHVYIVLQHPVILGLM